MKQTPNPPPLLDARWFPQQYMDQAHDCQHQQPGSSPTTPIRQLYTRRVIGMLLRLLLRLHARKKKKKGEPRAGGSGPGPKGDAPRRRRGLGKWP
mmetsp:Transcript_39503/g.74154  ORF Transcript_39503/g.74154 Transcript_39503/m.74154 type:complete len:95 (-) Transcript_39503:395-679(-)